MQDSINLPVFVGSGVTVENLADYISTHAIIIGSHLKAHGQYHENLDPIRVQHFMSKVHKLRQIAERMEQDPKWTQTEDL